MREKKHRIGIKRVTFSIFDYGMLKRAFKLKVAYFVEWKFSECCLYLNINWTGMLLLVLLINQPCIQALYSTCRYKYSIIKNSPQDERERERVTCSCHVAVKRR